MPLPARVLPALERAQRGGIAGLALDAERASGYRYSQRAYLIQLRRAGAGTALIDPVPLPDLSCIQEATEGAEWILHAATQDLACLAEVGLHPSSLFDTELAGRLLGYPRVGLATLVETILGAGMKKEHSAVDWSTRPLPEPWLEYAALDVEVLLELREQFGKPRRRLRRVRTLTIAGERCAHLAQRRRRVGHGVRRLRHRPRVARVARGLLHDHDWD